jgi:hypothetical protein
MSVILVLNESLLSFKNDLKKLTLELMKNGSSKVQETNQNLTAMLVSIF